MHKLKLFAVTCLILFSANLVNAQPPGAPNPDDMPPNPPPANTDNDDNTTPRSLGPAPVPAENPITEGKRVLGKILFWDEQLSSDDSVACGTCHTPAAGGADLRLSVNPGFDGIFGNDDDVVGSPGMRALDPDGEPLNDPLFGHGPQITGRATPSFFTSMYADENFWDGRATDVFLDPLDSSSIVIETGGALESQAVGPILSSVEMAQQQRTWQDVIDKLNVVVPLSLATSIPADMLDAVTSSPTYPALFEAAFGDNEVTPARIGMAIATYERTLVPNQTPWDNYVDGDLNAMTASQIAGWEAFNTQTPCGNCHRPPLFSDDNFRNIGLRPEIEDLGQFEVTGNNGNRGSFRTPSLRNTGLKRALMHVGWVVDVADAIDFYNAGANDTGHTQFTQRQSGIPGTNMDIDEIDVFANDPAMRAQVVDFIENALTDPRAAAEAFPFDRPVLASQLFSSPGIINTTIPGSTSDNSSTTASFLGSIATASAVEAPGAFSADESLAVNVQINVAEEDRQQAGSLYCIASYNGSFFALTESGNFTSWDGDPQTLPTARSVALLGDVQQMPIVERLTQISGQFALYVGYDTNDGVVRYNSSPVQFTVE